MHLKDAIPDLSFKVSDGGDNFSVGQKQLVLSIINTINNLITKLLLLGMLGESDIKGKSHHINGNRTPKIIKEVLFTLFFLLVQRMRLLPIVIRCK